MLVLKQNSKKSGRKGRNADLSFLTSIQRFKRQSPVKIGSRNFQQNIEQSWDRDKDEEKENLPGSSYGRLNRNRGSGLHNSNGSVSLACVPSLVTAAETRNIIHTFPGHTNTQSQQNDRSIANGVAQMTRPVSRNSRSTWAVYSSEVMSRYRPSLKKLHQTGNINVSPEKPVDTVEDYPPQEPFPIWFQNMVKPPGFSDTQSVKSSKTSKSSRSIGNSSLNGYLVQSSWIQRNSLSTAQTDPKVTVKYSIAELMDIFCGFVPPPPPEIGMFVNPEGSESESGQTCRNTNGNCRPKGRDSFVDNKGNCNMDGNNRTNKYQLAQNLKAVNSKSSAKPLRRQLLDDFNAADSSVYFENTKNECNAQNIQQREDRSETAFFRNLDANNDPASPYVRKITNYFDDMNLDTCSASKIRPVQLNFEREKQNQRKSSNKRITDYFNIDSINQSTTTPNFNLQTEGTLFSLHLNNSTTPIIKVPEFKVPCIPKNKHSTRGILDVLENNTQQLPNLTLPRSTTPGRSSMKRSKNRTQSTKKVKSLRFADFDPIPRSQTVDGDAEYSGSHLFPDKNFASSPLPFAVEQPQSMTDKLTSTESSFSLLTSTDMEISAYEFEQHRSNANSYAGGLGIIQSNYGSIALDSDLSQSKWEAFKNPYA